METYRSPLSFFYLIRTLSYEIFFNRKVIIRFKRKDYYHEFIRDYRIIPYIW